ncbi:hypothetical protein R6Q57_028792 [Mikania cordata]
MEILSNSETKPRARRRLVQSTLFPHKPQDNVVCVDEETESDADLEENEEDNCGSQNQVQKSKKRKPKAASQSRASRKFAVNGNEIGGKNTDEENPPATVNSKSPRKPRRRANSTTKKQQASVTPKKQQASVTPKKQQASVTPKKQQASVTPHKQQLNLTSKNGINGILNEDYSDKMLASPPKQIPDLRLEAKMIAEENSRIFAGKQIHPFFSFRKTGKKSTDCTDTENKWCHAGIKGSKIDFSPVHIFEKSQTEIFSVDWRNWTFSESIPLRTKQESEDSCSQLISEGLVDCLWFDNFHDISPPGISLCQNIKVQEDLKIGGFLENSEFVKNLDSQRMASNYHGCSYQSANSLWTTKYQPEKAIEICGNSESVKFLNEWLQLWREKGSRTNKCSTDTNSWIMQDVDLNYCPSDTDSEYSNEDNSLKNVLLVTGPVGSGKSAAIYACAKEQGFQVIEVNTSDWRNGALVKQKFGEAVESHWLQCSMASMENPENKSPLKSTPAKSVNDVVEYIPLSDDEDSKYVVGPAVKPTNSQSGTKTLILFEDVDVTTYEDRGLIATIQQLAEISKRPIILTSNSDDPDLPNNLDRIEVGFKIPTSDELLSLAYMVCYAEKAEIDPCLIERFIDHCHGDIRKTIMLLQFWGQGENQRKDSEVRNTYAPLLFDTSAGHHVLPKVISFDYTSRLSELIYNEITKSTLLTQKDAIFMETIEEEDENNNAHDINCKKDEMLRIHCFEQEENSLALFSRRTLQKKHDPVISYDSEPCWNEDILKIADDLNEEILVETRNSRRKYNAVLSSDSEEECFNEDTCHPSEVPCSKINADVSCVPESSYVPETEIENGTMMCSSGYVDSGIERGPTNTDCETNNHGYDCVADKVIRDLSLDNEQVHGEEIGDSHIEPTEAIPRDYQMMDECSRIDFSKKSEFNIGPIYAGSTDRVQEAWRKLRNCSNDLSQHVSIEEKDTLEALGISYAMTNLISEADLLVADCQSLTCDNLKPSMISYEKSHSHSWHDDQLQMASTFAQHGFCVFAKRSFASGSNDKMDLAWEMLAASTNAISLGKLICQNNNMIKSLGNQKLQRGVYSKSIFESPICNTIRSIVPAHSQLLLKGNVFHEYLSSLAHISRSESSRLSEAVNNSNQRRKRVARNYLSNGALKLSSEDISLLDQYKCYQKHSSETKTKS